MNLAQLNAKIDALPPYSRALTGELDQSAARYLRDERLGLLGVHAGQEPTEEQVAIVHAQLFGELEQKDLTL